MAAPTFYNAGTASVAAGSTTVTGQNTIWLGALRDGDLFMAAGLAVRILSVVSNTELTLAIGWPGAARVAATYEARFTTDSERIVGMSNEILNRLALGELLVPDAVGTLDERVTYDGRQEGFLYLQTDVIPFVMFVKNSDASADWSIGNPLQGAQGYKGWAPQYALVPDGTRRVYQLTGYVGGEGPTPTDGIGQYLGVTGLVSDIAQATDARGPAGTGNVTGPALATTEDEITAFAAGMGGVLKKTSVSRQALIRGIHPLSLINVIPSWDVCFVEGLTPANMNFARASTATRYNAMGYLETVAANQPRHDYDPATGEYLGVLMEEARTNLLIDSNNIPGTNWPVVNATIGAQRLGPDGLISLYKLVEDTSSALHYTANAPIAVTSGQIYTASCYVAAGERTQIRLRASGSGFSGSFYFDAVTGVFSAVAGVISYGAKPIGNGIWRVWWTFTATATTTGRFLAAPAVNGAENYQGNGASGIYFGFAQVEQGPFVTSYIPTTSGAVARSADSMTFSVGPWLNQREGTFVMIGKKLMETRAVGGSHDGIFSIDDGTSNNRISAIWWASNGRVATYNYYQGTNGRPGDTTPPASAADKFTAAFAWGVGTDQNVTCVNGTFGSANTTTGSPTGMNIIRVGVSQSGLPMNGHVLETFILPKRIANSDIQAITGAAA